MSNEAALEFDAIKTVHEALQPLDDEARSRVLAYIVSLLGVSIKAPSGQKKTANEDIESEGNDEDESSTEKNGNGPKTFSSFAELYDAAQPKSNGEKALVVGYWLQVCQQSDSFTAAAANKELMHLGHKVANITDAIDSVKDQKPALLLQLKKSGSSKQARKTYKVSHAGVQRVEEMIRG